MTRKMAFALFFSLSIFSLNRAKADDSVAVAPDASEEDRLKSLPEFWDRLWPAIWDTI